MDLIDWLDAQGTKEHHEARDLIERLTAENAAQLAELHAISVALGTNEGHSSVTHIDQLKAERDMLVGALKAIVNTHNPDSAIRAEIRWELAEEALAKVKKT